MQTVRPAFPHIIRHIIRYTALLPALVLISGSVLPMGGIEGTFEYAIDAPWRIEPVVDSKGVVSYGAIPIQITVLDENVIPLDSFLLLPTGRMIGNFCDLEIAQGNVSRHLAFKDLAEVETTGNASTTWRTGSWIRGHGAPPHATCLPGSQPCAAFQSPHGTSEWQATAWFTPRSGFTPGADIMLTLTAKFSRTPQIACTSGKASDFLSLKNYVSVHAGEAPLPRFHDNRWAYGDLHFHGQGTDNEGEAGYNYRGVVRAMGAMGLDFVLAVEHASDSDQILDLDYNGPVGAIFEWHLVSRNGTVLRDMDSARFEFLHRQLWGAGGVNRKTALDGGAGARPQNVRGHGAAPQIFLGGEVDVIPELPPTFRAGGSFLFGNGVEYKLSNLCGAWTADLHTSCPEQDTVQQDLGVTILRDVQGLNSLYPARAHLVYMPRDPADTKAFVSSRTGPFGGASRHLTVGDGVLTEMEGTAGVQKGYTFLAHPVPGGDCLTGGTPKMAGGLGPDVVPYTPLMLDEAFRSKAVLGLELWNEDIRMKNIASGAERNGDTHEIGYESSGGSGGHDLRNDEPNGFITGKFEMFPWSRFPETSFAQPCTSMEWTLHHGLKELDDLLLRGLVPSETAALPWLAAGEPRRLFVAGGSDAHGDLNYHRGGYATGLEQVDDMAIGKPRNLVMAGAPQVTLVKPKLGNTVLTSKAGPGVTSTVVNNGVQAFSQAQVLNALIEGAFAVTDGPALRIAVDRNGNGVIDDGDIPMGGIVELYGEKILPLLVEWESTPEWGEVQQVEIVIGAVRSARPELKTLFAPVANGPRSAGTPSFGVARTLTSFTGHKMIERADGYSEDPTGGLMRFYPNSMSGRRSIDLPLAALSIVEEGGTYSAPNRLFIRAFARSQRSDGNGHCTPDPKSGKCLLRYALTNPVWAITPAIAAGSCPAGRPRAIDSDGDGLPDGCDPCPHKAGPQAICQVNTGGGDVKL